MNLIFILFEDHMDILQNSLKDCLHFIKDVQKAFSKITDQEAISNVSSSADKNCFKLARSYIHRFIVWQVLVICVARPLFLDFPEGIVA